MISVTLITEVLGLKVYSVKQKNDSTLEYTYDSIGETRTSTINIHELTYKCKEWMSDNGFFSKTTFKNNLSFSCEIGPNVGDIMDKWEKTFTGTFENEAIFKACEYLMNYMILENIIEDKQ